MVKKNNRNGGDVKPFQKKIGITSLLKNEPSTSHRSENWPSPRSTARSDFWSIMMSLVSGLYPLFWKWIFSSSFSLSLILWSSSGIFPDLKVRHEFGLSSYGWAPNFSYLSDDWGLLALRWLEYTIRDMMITFDQRLGWKDVGLCTYLLIL